MSRRAVAGCASVIAVVATLAMPQLASAGQIVYVHNLNGTGGDLWVMNDDGSNQRALLTQAQAGAGSLDQPSLFPSSSALAFQGDTKAPDGTCDTNCVSVMTLVNGSLHRISAAPVDCMSTATQSCLITADNTPTLTADGRVLYLHTGSEFGVGCALYCGVYGGSGNQYEVQSDLGGDQANVWPIPTGVTYWEPAGNGGFDSSPAADPADAHLIAYPALEDPANPTNTVDPLAVDDDAAEHPFVVSDDDAVQNFVTWSPDGKYVLDIEGGTQPGIWAYTALPYTDPGWKAFYVMATPPQTAGGGGLGYGLSMASDGRILFTSSHDIYSLPASCGPVAGAAAPTSGTPSPNCTIAQAAQLTSSGTDEEPTWTSESTPLSYAPPQAGQQGQQGQQGQADVTHFGVTHSKVKHGKAVVLSVTLSASAQITIKIFRLVPASGHGRHRHKAHYVSAGTLTLAGKAGANSVSLTKLHGRLLRIGRYKALVSLGGKTSTVAFTIHG